ncbi:MAG: DUF305 domain-containing protein, partial [Syntrophothermus sp.]
MKKQLFPVNRLHTCFFTVILLAVLLPFWSNAFAQEPTVEDSVMKKEGTSDQTSDERKSEGKMSHESMSQQDKKGHAGMMNDMQQMQKKMSGIKMTGDPDHDFAVMMIEHHKGAVNMSKKEVSSGSESQVKSIAHKVITDQNREIKELQAFVKSSKPMKKTDSDQMQNETGSSGKNMMNKMDDMRKDMEKVDITGNQDKDYVSMMIVHHQHAVDMAKDYLDKGKDEKLKQIAQKMID